MYPAAFEYHAPTSVKEALGLLGKHKDDAKLLAGGHSLIPMMKLRLASRSTSSISGRCPGSPESSRMATCSRSAR